MGTQFVKSTINNSLGQLHNASVILPLPTGSGKTEGTCIYAARQVEKNARAATEITKPVGVIIVTCLIEDADALATKINGAVGRIVSVASHSQRIATSRAIFNADVLIIKHKA